MGCVRQANWPGVSEDGEVVQRIASVAGSHFQLIEHDLRQHGNAKKKLIGLIAAEARTSINLVHGPLIRSRR
jgi:hypothetical protein